ncbi:MAG TPA: replication-relaxation family protein [Bryobacteraceae bacterium]|jgi:hypothetical protein|nr:replication-relaxation family protein [Bryobacteraceae bacterium]
MTGNNQGIILQDRDRHLLRELGVMRVIDREQAKRVAGFGSTTRANNRLLMLTRAGFLRRFFLGTVGGARKALYAQSPKGAALVEVLYRGPRRATDQTLAADFFVTHQLWINQVYCLLKYHPIPVADARFVRWLSFYEPLFSGIPLIPDGYAEVVTSTKTLAMFLEIDLGHESRSIWQKKVQGYLRYAVSGSFTTQFNQPQFRTLVVANSERRMASLRAVTAMVTEKIFWFTTLDAVTSGKVWSPIWQRPTGEERQPLL